VIAATYACSCKLSKRLRAPRRTVGRAVGLMIVVAMVLLPATPASARLTHVFSGYYGAAGSTPANPFPLSNPSGVAVDNSGGSSAGDFYVTDTANHRVEKFDSSGNFILMFGKGVDQTTGANICTAASGDTCQAGTSGSAPGAFTTPMFIAVDGSSGASSGDVYVGDTGDNIVSKFDSGGNLVTGWKTGGQLSLGGMGGVAVDPNGYLFAFDGGTVFKYSQSGSSFPSFGVPRETDPIGLAVDSADNLFKVNASPSVEEFTASADIGQVTTSETTTGLGVDPFDNSLYVDNVDGNRDIGYYTFGLTGCMPASYSGCAPGDTFGGTKLNGAQGVAIDKASHIVYVANSGSNNVAVFGPKILPDAVTGLIEDPTKTSVTLTGRVDPAGGPNISECHFEYGTDTTYSLGSVPCSPATPYSGATNVTAEVTGLTEARTYHFRVVATTATGTTDGQDRSFQSNGSNVSHSLIGTIGSASSNPADPYPLSGPTDVAFDQTTQDYYVTDPGNHRIEKFDSAGNFILMFGKGVDQTTGGNVCTAASGDTCQAGTAGSSAGSFETPTYLAVDNSNSSSRGDVYVGDPGDNLVSKFDSSGNIVSGWGPGGVKDGSDTDLSTFGPAVQGVAVGPSDGDLYVSGGCCDNVFEYTQDGTYEGPYQNVSGVPWLKVDAKGDYFYAQNGFFGSVGGIGESLPPNGGNREDIQATTDSPTTGFEFDPTTGEIYQSVGTLNEGAPTDHPPRVDHYSADCNPPVAPCEPADSFGSGQLLAPAGVGVEGISHTVYVADPPANDVAVFGDVRPVVTTGPPTNVTDSAVTLTGHIDPLGRGDIVSCYFEYGFDKTYGTKLPCTPDPASSNFKVPTDVTATITGLSPGTLDHYRLVVSNSAGATSQGVDETFITTQPPAIDGLASANLTETSADLNAQVNPNGLPTTYHFEYGPAASYGQVAPVPDGTLSASNSDQTISVHLDNLTPHLVYHYRLVATNADGTTVSEDQTFNFYPPPCPNENVRQQTQANYLPDCRAYELVSPGDAGGTQIRAEGPNTGYASNPPRFAFTGQFSSIPEAVEAGGKPMDGDGDLYVATRTDHGWVTRYVGIPSNQAAEDGGPAQGPPNSTPRQEFRSPSAIAGVHSNQNSVLTDPSMSRFVDFNEGNQSIESIFGADFQNHTVISSDAGYVWAADGSALGRWPTNLGAVPPGSYSGYPTTASLASSGLASYNGGPPTQVAPGGKHALDCPWYAGNANFCPGDVTASADLNHFVFASTWNVFAPGGQLTPPGSVYDNNTSTGTVAVASKTPAGDDIPSEPTDGAGDPLQIPGVSHDGSHILMAAGGAGPCGSASCPPMPCEADYSDVRRCLMQPSHLYMRVDDAITYDVSQGHDVHYVGMTGDGSKVYFTTAQQLTPEDTDTSVDLYMWSEATNSITLISKGNNGAGNSDSCKGGLSTDTGGVSTNCDITNFNQLFYCSVRYGPLDYGAPGNCLSDSFISSESGDIYFISQEKLDGTRGIFNQENLYVYHNGQVQWVTTFTGRPYCYTDSYSFPTRCDSIVRMQVAPDGSHMAFVTASRVSQSQYDNQGKLEMYRYEPSTRKMVCVSCNPSGAPPTSNVTASQDGLFLANDGRVAFSTEDALVHSDTNNGQDVYEYVDGRAQLITPGTGETGRAAALEFLAAGEKPGLVGISADGRDIYFGTYQTLVPSDHNGLFIKYYDARSGGGFPAAAPPPPCTAADECHGAGSLPPPASPNGTGVRLGSGGNVSGSHLGHHHSTKRHKRQRHKRHNHRSHQLRRHSRHNRSASR